MIWLKVSWTVYFEMYFYFTQKLLVNLQIIAKKHIEMLHFENLVLCFLYKLDRVYISV